MKMKKVLALVLALVLTITATIGGTTAYLTKKLDPKQNVFTVGDIEIDLTEKVGVIGDGGEVEEKTEGADFTGIMPGDYLKKEVTVANTGETPAYVEVTVDVNNFLETQKVIDGYGDDDENAEKMLDFVFDGWGLTVQNRYVEGKKDMSYKVLNSEVVDENILHVDSAKRIYANDVAHFSIENWFKTDAEKAATGYTVADAPGNSFYAPGMEDYSLRFTYYMLLEAGDKVTLFDGLNVPAEFTAEQLAMFDGLEIDVTAKAIQADNMGVHPDYVDEARTAFAVLKGLINAEDLDVNNGSLEAKLDYTLENGGEIDLGGETFTNGTFTNSGNAVISNGGLNSTSGGVYGAQVAYGSEITLNNVNLTTAGGGVNVRGTVVWNGGSIINNNTTTNPRHVFYVGAQEGVADGHLTINGGEFTFNPANPTRRGSYLCADGAGATIIVNGGTFHKPSTNGKTTAPIYTLNGGTVIIYGGRFRFDPSAFVADGYQAVKGTDGYWTVSAI